MLIAVPAPGWQTQSVEGSGLCRRGSPGEASPAARPRAANQQREPPMTTRRQFLQHAALAGAGYFIAGASAATSRSPSEKLRIAAVGVGGRGASNLRAVSGEQ